MFSTSLLQFLPIGFRLDFCLNFPGWWTLTCKLKKKKKKTLFLPNLLLVMQSIAVQKVN